MRGDISYDPDVSVRSVIPKDTNLDLVLGSITQNSLSKLESVVARANSSGELGMGPITKSPQTLGQNGKLLGSVHFTSLNE